MLCELIIENVAVIEKADIVFKEGFTCLTGETGAGKSIIIDSINAIMGERISKNIVRTGAEKASIVAVFENLSQSITDKASEMDIDLSDDCIVSRQITADGKSSARINSVPYPVSVLKRLFSDAINIHGQHDSQRLLNPAKHLDILDSFGTDSAVKATYRQFFKEYTRLNKEIKQLEEVDKNKQEALDLLSFQVEEIESARLSEEEEEQLNADKKLIKNAENILEGLSNAYEYLFGSDDNMGALSMLQQACADISGITDCSDVLADISERLNECAAAAQDTGFDLKNFLDDFDVDISSIDRIEERLDTYYKLKRKYGPEVKDVLAYYENSKAELEKIEFARERLEQLFRQQKVAVDKLSISADRLTQSRKEVFEKLSRGIHQALEFLNMPFVKFYLSCEKKDFTADGRDDIEFVISTNKGEAAKPLAKIASGGELSRIMLAIKSVLAEKEDTHTLIFDEIDAGVSGSAAVKIGKLLKDTSKGKQVLCVTHSPQIAAFADNHMLIEKVTDDSATYTHVRRLEGEDRVREIARIISGENITPTALLNAREMIESSKNG